MIDSFLSCLDILSKGVAVVQVVIWTTGLTARMLKRKACDGKRCTNCAD